jgi:hypothetical protein
VEVRTWKNAALTGGLLAKNVHTDGGIHEDNHETDEYGIAHGNDSARDAVDDVSQLLQLAKDAQNPRHAKHSEQTELLHL